MHKDIECVCKMGNDTARQQTGQGAWPCQNPFPPQHPEGQGGHHWLESIVRRRGRDRLEVLPR